MNKQRIALIVASVIGMLAVFMPWASIPIVGTLNGLKAGGEGSGTIGYLTLLFFAVSLLIALIGDKKLLVAKTKYISAFARFTLSRFNSEKVEIHKLYVQRQNHF